MPNDFRIKRGDCQDCKAKRLPVIAVKGEYETIWLCARCLQIYTDTLEEYYLFED